MSGPPERRYPAEQAVGTIAERLRAGWSLLGIEGFWLEADGVRPDLAYIFDGGPEGLGDFEQVAAFLSTWPRTEDFAVEFLLVRP